MKIKVFAKNNRVMAYGSAYGKKIKALAVCNEDSFDEALGVEVATRKYNIKERMAKRDLHKDNISELKRTIAWCQHEIEVENEIVARHDSKIAEMESEYNAWLSDKFSK